MLENYKNGAEKFDRNGDDNKDEIKDGRKNINLELTSTKDNSSDNEWPKMSISDLSLSWKG